MFRLNRFRIIILVIIVVVFCIFQFGIEIGTLRLGKQADFAATIQKPNVEQSHFYRNYFDGDSLVVLNYWATWCMPCIAEMPILNEVKRDFQDKKVAFVSLSVDTDSLKLIEFIQSNKFEFRDITIENQSYRTAIMNILRGKKPDEWIGSYSVPMTFIVKNKKVLEMIDGTVEKEELVDIINKHL
jgi:thiol-disulfide isomerase/thioredoxin